MVLELVERTCEMLGTKFHISVACKQGRGRSAEALIKEAVSEGMRIEKQYSRFLDGNMLAHLNNRVGEWVHVRDELFELIKFGEDVKVSTNGAFNIAIKTILEGWGYDKDYSFVENKPGDIGFVTINHGEKKVKISSEIDLGGLGKGYAIDRMGSILEKECEDFCIDGGGDILCRGKNENGKLWKILLGHPTDLKQAIGFVNVENFACASSNSSLRAWGNKHHLVNTSTCETADDMLAVHTQATSTMLADAYSTAFFVMGYGPAKKWLSENNKKIPVEAMIIGLDGKVFFSKFFRGELFEG